MENTESVLVGYAHEEDTSDNSDAKGKPVRNITSYDKKLLRKSMRMHNGQLPLVLGPLT